MPLQTFYNLPPERQKEIVDIAYDEFINNAYHKASMNRIIKLSGIAKGGFYRYFKDKMDVYTFLIQNLNQENINHFNELHLSNDGNIYSVLKGYMMWSYDLDQSHPRYSAFLYMVSRNRSLPELEDLVIGFKLKATSLFTNLLKAYYSEKNSLSAEEIDFLGFNIEQLMSGFIDYISTKYNINCLNKARKGLPLLDIEKSEFLDVVDVYLKLIRNIIEGEFGHE